MNRAIPYRPEIDGLRTLAVTAVIIFHLNSHMLKGGFLGLDVFFVISGFLITSIIHRDLLQRRFSFWAFWKRRFKRLYPALTTVVITTMAVGLFVLPNPERAALPRQALGALFSFSNILLWKTSGGYWDSASESISLLHTWSLSLEEQFYVCFPIFLFLSNLLFKRRTGIVTAILLILSLSLCLLFSYSKPLPSFYLLPFRMWELLIGSLLAIYSPVLVRPVRSAVAGSALHFVGLALIITSYFTIENKDGFPGIFPLLTCLGTSLLIAVKCDSSLVTRALSSRPCVYVGKLSYSLYLWHWPIIVFAYYLSHEPNPITIIAITFVASMVSYHLIEHPMRQAPRLPKFPALAAVSVLVLCFLGFASLPKSPLLKNLGNFDDAYALTRGWEYEATDQVLDEKYNFGTSLDQKKIIVLGSSHARVICKPIETYASENNYAFLSLACSGVGVTSTNNSHRPRAEEINAKRLDLVAKAHPAILVIAGKWSAELKEKDQVTIFKNWLVRALSSSDRVIVLGQVPLIELPEKYGKDLRKFLVAKHFSNQSQGIVSSKAVMEANSKIRQIVSEIKNKKLTYIDPTAVFTNNEGGIRLLDNHGRFLFSDNNHINDAGAELLFNSRIYPSLLTNNQ